MAFDWKERTVDIVGHLPAGERGEFLHPVTDSQIPDISCKNLWEFELTVKVWGRRYNRAID